MPLVIRTAAATDFDAVQRMVIDSFEPITWQKTLDDKVGPLNGQNWRARWRSRLRKIFETQIVLLGEENGVIAAMASLVLDQDTALGYVDVLAVSCDFQGRGLGREMLRGALQHLKDRGMKYAQLDCLTGNDVGNALYESEGFQEVARHIRWFRKL